MSSLTIRDLPPRTLSSLRTRAKANRRSLNGEILFIFDWIADHGTFEDLPSNDSTDPIVMRQKNEIEDLIGTWSDSRPAHTIIDEIVNARTVGREIAL